MPHHRNTIQHHLASSSSAGSLLTLHQVSKAYQTPSGSFIALRDIDLGIHQNEFVAVVGKSGSGKSTLINLITGIDRPSTGEVMVDGTPIHRLSENQLALWRGRNVGIVFQFFQLLPVLTIIENVMLPMDLCNTYPASLRRDRALTLLEQVGIAAQAQKLPTALSGGEQQRAAIARALANDPPLIVADEPTGNLDTRTADAVLKLFTDLVVQGKTVVFVTHERDIRRHVSRQITLVDGRVDDDARGEAHHRASGEVQQ
ncbi:ABC transporter ATP-binding protein [Reticulibacter mediterranei]|uniref:ABC transporter ATP-binding protein n=1 Tax=Reticulibacter mediterranei TaxID=2778369 RepID=A0A8J3IJM2_9CHLR|nr:ABC transporter ATP-binding protein [Reticulibacter mediterranei]GHO93695.1 ABC transporter ATP-binding protein [Reticulibacter mediterranei]